MEVMLEDFTETSKLSCPFMFSGFIHQIDDKYSLRHLQNTNHRMNPKQSSI